MRQNLPAALSPGDQLALVTPLGVPSAGWRDYSEQVATVQRQGYMCVDATTASDTPRSRSASFNEAITAGNKALLPVGGNRFGQDTLNRIDYTAFQTHQPLFATFSAGSSLACALNERTGVTTFYGPHVRFVAPTAAVSAAQQLANEQFWATLRGEKLSNDLFVSTETGGLQLRNIYRDAGWDANAMPIPFVGDDHPFSEAPKGRLLPIFMQSLLRCAEMGIITDVKERLLVLESDRITFSEARIIVRSIHKLLNLKQAAAVCIAAITPHPFKDLDGSLAKELFDRGQAAAFVGDIRHLLEDAIPVTYGFPLGHGTYKYTVPFGTPGQLDPATNDITILEPSTAGPQ